MGSKYTNQGVVSIYDKLIEKVDEVIVSLEIKTDDDEVNVAKENAVVQLRGLHEEITEEYKSLKKNTEWDKFTIAFYGETNAGKSTIIEALRLIFKENSKLDSQSKFIKLAEQNHITQEDFQIVRNEILQLDGLITDLKKQLSDFVEEEEQNLENIKQKLVQLKQLVEEEARHRNLWQKILHLFMKSELELQYANDEAFYIKKKSDYDKRQSVLNAEIIEHEERYNYSWQKEASMKEKCNILAPYADGKIIGTGVSDFTRENTIYHFNIGDEPVDIIDVPGIEGNEQKVIDSIMEAVQKAHAVFYVTRKAGAPQTGDVKEGTLEKIKNHLGAQTEVWTIFNQSVTNPIRLKKELVSADDYESLSDLNKVMVDRLGKEHYKGEICLSAYPVFLALAKCLVPGSKDLQSQAKFLKAYTERELLDLTMFQKFVDGFSASIIGDWRNKIVISNYNKASNTLQKVITCIDILLKEKFKPLENNFSTAIKNSKNQIENEAVRLRANFRTSVDNSIRTFEHSVRTQIYAEIENNISNDNFKNHLQVILEAELANLKTNFSNAINSDFKEFQTSVEKILEKNKEYLDAIASSMPELQKFGKIELNINIDNGINTGRLISAILIGILSVNPAEIALAIIQFLRAVWSFFSDDYKKKQQRKAADENLRNIANNIKGSLEKSLEDASIEMDSHVTLMKNSMNKPLKIVIEMNKNLLSMRNELNNLNLKIKEKQI